jgi:large subunit ribosomal protein L13
MAASFMFTNETVNRNWYIIDAEGKSLGRVAAAAAQILNGKHRPEFTPHINCGEFVIIINADKAVLTGNKLNDKHYYHHSGYIGGLKDVKYSEIMAKKPEFVIEHAVKGMLPKTRLGEAILKNLKVYAGAEHPHAAQTPKEIKLNEIK